MLVALGLYPAAAPAQRRYAQFASAERGMVAASTPYAVEAGVRSLEEGGNAVDAAVAAAFALAVTDPAMTSLGGRCHILVAFRNGRLARIDGATQAPAVIPSLPHPKAVRDGFGVVPAPGAPKALVRAVASYGQLSLRAVLAPAIDLAENGFAVTAAVAKDWRAREAVFRSDPGASRWYLKPDGSAYREGEIYRNPPLARLLRILATSGPDPFYAGEIAETIAGDVSGNGGFLRLEDLRDYEAPEAGIIESKYRSLRTASASVRAWGNTMAEMLNIQNHFAISPGEPKPDEVLVQALVIAQALADRPQGLETLAPKPGGFPIEQLSSPEFAAGRAKLIRRRLRGEIPLNPGGEPPADHDTTHVSVMDAGGNAVALTTSIGPAFGAGVVSPELGFFYAHSYRMRSHPAPDARDDTEMTPTIVFQNRRPWLAIGAAGSQRIPPAIYQVIANLVDRRYPLRRAVSAPRLYAVGAKVWLEAGFSDEVVRLLRDRGYQVVMDPKSFHLGRVHAVLYNAATGRYEGAADPRYDGVTGGPE